MSARILVAESDEVLQIVVGQMLRRKSFRCDIAGDGAAALAMLGENEYDVILLDLTLPVVSAFDIIDLASAKHPSLLSRVIAMTSILDPLADMDHLPLFAVARKPVNLRQLLRLVTQCLRAQAAPAAATDPTRTQRR